jgi:dihydroorotate dehydrogenase (NAD+) catalytic subunit
MVDLSVKIGDITLQNPVQPASGAFSWEYNDVIDLNRLGALVAKTICREPRLGNPTPRMAETEAGIIQSIGLPGKGIDYFIEHIVPSTPNSNRRWSSACRRKASRISPRLRKS